MRNQLFLKSAIEQHLALKTSICVCIWDFIVIVSCLSDDQLQRKVLLRDAQQKDETGATTAARGILTRHMGKKKSRFRIARLLVREAMKPPALIETGLAKTQAPSSAFPVTSVLAMN